MDRWLSTSKLRIESTSSPQSSTRTGVSSVSGKISRIPPRIANWPSPSTWPCAHSPEIPASFSAPRDQACFRSRFSGYFSETRPAEAGDHTASHRRDDGSSFSRENLLQHPDSLLHDETAVDIRAVKDQVPGRERAARPYKTAVIVVDLPGPQLTVGHNDPEQKILAESIVK